MDKKIIFGNDARIKVLDGINIVVDAVKVTLGYGGRTVIISDGGYPTRTTKDGVTVANSISLKDDVLNAGAKMAKEISSKTSDDVGDGTTSILIIFQEIVKEGMTMIQSGVNPTQLKKGMDAAVKSIVATLDKMAIQIDGNNELLKQIASVSANNDEEIGKIVGEVFDKLGPYGIIAIEDSKTYDTRIESVNGFQFASGWFSHYFITDHDRNICELIKPYVLIVEGKINSSSEVVPIMEKCAVGGRSLLLIAEDFDATVVATIHTNRNVFAAACVKFNFIGDTKEELMVDLCAMTGAELITEKTGKDIKNIQLSALGECEKVICTKEETTIVSGRQVVEMVNSRIEDAKIKISNAKHPFIKQLQERRAAKLSGGIAICYVGGATEVERSEKKDRIEDSVRATKAAIEEGIVPGGGTALIRCIPNLDALKYDNEAEKQGITLVKKAIQKPAFQICENASGTGALNVSKIKEKHGNIGYNAKTDELEDLVKAGIIDPKKVVRVCIENSVSAAAQVLISEALIVNDI